MELKKGCLPPYLFLLKVVRFTQYLFFFGGCHSTQKCALKLIHIFSAFLKTDLQLFLKLKKISSFYGSWESFTGDTFFVWNYAKKNRFFDNPVMKFIFFTCFL